jgi:serine/threonine protein kinase
MAYICTNCGMITESRARLCPNRSAQCPPGTLSLLFAPGDKLEDFEILEQTLILRTAVLYRVRYGRETLLLKLAHKDYEEQLKREATLLGESDPHPALPRLAPLLTQNRRVYSKSSVQDEVKYYTLYQNVQAQSLRELLTQKVYFSPQHAAWLVVGLADVVAYLHLKRDHLVLNLSPDTILIRRDKAGIPRPMLIDLATASAPGGAKIEWFKNSWQTSYLAPEQIKGENVYPATDVYALGLVLYELLAGQPAFPIKLGDNEALRSYILENDPLPLNQRRPELIQGVSGVVGQALQKKLIDRQPDVRTFAKGLRTLFDEVPAEQTRMAIDPRLLVGGVAVGIALLLIIILLLLTQS